MRTLLLMIITPPDLPIAKYCLASIIPALSDQIHLKVFFNGVSPDTQKKFLADQKLTENVFLKSNWNYLSKNQTTISKQIGASYEIMPGVTDFREGLYESGGELWSRELVIEKDYELVGIVDADFELFSTELLNSFQSYFLQDNNLGFWSVDYSPKQSGYEPFSKSNAWVAERWHTWFCVYRRLALEKECGFYYYEEQTPRGVVKYDHSALLQKKLITLHGFYGKSLQGDKRGLFLHYGGFAKNRSLAGFKLASYRFLRIGKHNGYVHLLKTKLLANPLRILFSVCYRVFRMNRFDRERTRYLFET